MKCLTLLKRKLKRNSSRKGSAHMRYQPIVTRNGCFNNPFPTWQGLPPGTALLKVLPHFLWESILLTVRRGGGAPGSSSKSKLLSNLPIHRPIFNKNKATASKSPRLQYHWLGHATVLWQFVQQDINVLCDPIFSKRAGPTSWFGSKRYIDSVCAVGDLPRIDAVAISHNHFDHLDLRTLKDIEQNFGNGRLDVRNNGTLERDRRGVKYFLPMGLKQWFVSQMGLRDKDRVVELSWWESAIVSSPTTGSSITLQFVPAQHWSGRTLFDRFVSLWGGWLLSTDTEDSVQREKTRKSVTAYFVGDTGWTGEDLFGSILDVANGYIDVAAIPIGAYKPRNFMSQQHVSPKEAYKIFEACKAQTAFAIHWGTFPLTFEKYMQPKQRLDAFRDKRFFTMGHGESRILE